MTATRAALIAATLAALSACSTTTTPEIEAAFARSDWPAIDRPHRDPIGPRSVSVFSDQGGAFEIDMIRGEINPL